jgi:hypothetical protein
MTRHAAPGFGVLFGILLLAPALPAQRHDIGFVLSLEGPWLADGQPLRKGQAVASGSRITLAADADFARNKRFFVSFVLANDSTRFRACDTRRSCDLPFVLPESLNAPTSLVSRISEAFALIFKDPERYAGVISRDGSGATQLPDGVIRLAAGQLAIGPLFQNITPGLYAIQFRHVESVSQQTWMMDFDWDGRRLSAPPPSGLQPGLYLVALYRTTANADPLGVEAWVLVDTPARYDRSSTAFREAASLAQSWAAGSDANDLASLKHAYLEYLSSH